MITFHRQLNLRNRDVVISNPQKKVVENQASTSVPNSNKYFRGINNNRVKGNDTTPLQDPPTRNMENIRDIVLVDKTITPFSFEFEISKLKVSLLFNEIRRKNEYRNQLLKMLMKINL